MAGKRWSRPLVYGASISTALILAVRGIAGDIATGQRSGPVLAVMATVMVLGLLTSAYGIYCERHVLHAHVRHRSKVQKRLARRKMLVRRRRTIAVAMPAHARDSAFSLRAWFAAGATYS